MIFFLLIEFSSCIIQIFVISYFSKIFQILINQFKLQCIQFKSKICVWTKRLNLKYVFRLLIHVNLLCTAVYIIHIMQTLDKRVLLLPEQQYTVQAQTDKKELSIICQVSLIYELTNIDSFLVSHFVSSIPMVSQLFLAISSANNPWLNLTARDKSLSDIWSLL